MALAFYDRIRASKSNIIITAYGLVASAAVIILAAGDTRRMGKNAWVMVHEDTVVLDEDSRVTKAEGAIRSARALEDQWNNIMASRTKTAALMWGNYHQAEKYFSARECLKLGLIEEIV